MKQAVILIGHGGIPTDFPVDKVGRLKALETERQRLKTPISPEEQALDHEIRTWPRTPKTDPFCFGIQAIAQKLAQKIPDKKLVIAYNEFCGPSIPEAAETLISNDFEQITLLTTMFTPGGIHSEFEIPKITRELKLKYPQVQIIYPWPFDLEQVAHFYSAVLKQPQPTYS